MVCIQIYTYYFYVISFFLSTPFHIKFPSYSVQKQSQIKNKTKLLSLQIKIKMVTSQCWIIDMMVAAH